MFTPQLVRPASPAGSPFATNCAFSLPVYYPGDRRPRPLRLNPLPVNPLSCQGRLRQPTPTAVALPPTQTSRLVRADASRDPAVDRPSQAAPPPGRQVSAKLPGLRIPHTGGGHIRLRTAAAADGGAVPAAPASPNGPTPNPRVLRASRRRPAAQSNGVISARGQAAAGATPPDTQESY